MGSTPTKKRAAAGARRRASRAGGKTQKRSPKRGDKPRAGKKASGGKPPAKTSPGKSKPGKPRKRKQRKSPPRERKPATDVPAIDDLPEFAVAFIDGSGAAHVAVTAAPDPAAALADLLEQAAALEEPFLDDLVAVMVSHPTTWEAVNAQVLSVFDQSEQ